MNEKLCEQLETEFLKYQIEEDVEDVLLYMAEALADMEVLGKEITYKALAGNIMLEVCGICEADEESQDEVSVFLKTFKIGTKEFEIQDYLL